MRERTNPGVSVEQQLIDNKLNEAIYNKKLDEIRQILAQKEAPSLAGNYSVFPHPLVMAAKHFPQGLEILCQHFKYKGAFPEITHQFSNPVHYSDARYLCEPKDFLKDLYRTASPESKKILDGYLTEEQKYTPSQRAEQERRRQQEARVAQESGFFAQFKPEKKPVPSGRKKKVEPPFQLNAK